MFSPFIRDGFGHDLGNKRLHGDILKRGFDAQSIGRATEGR